MTQPNDTTMNDNAKKIFRFTSGSSFGGMCYYPENDAAKSVVPAKRKALRPDEFVELINAGNVVELGVRTFVGTPIAWLVVKPSDAQPDARLARAEANLAKLKDDYQQGERFDLRQKYLDEIHDEIEKAHAVVEFLRAHS